MTPDRLGVFGGTFDPLHVGHLVVAQDAFDALELDRLMLVPARQSPLRSEPPRASPDQRLQMVRAAVQGDSRFEVRDTEIRREGPSFTVDTVRTLRGESPEADLYLLIGVDQWAGFAEWREPVEIGRLARIAVMARDGERPNAARGSFGPGGGPDHVEVPVTRVDVSASLVRRRVAQGLSIRYLVPDAVREIIESENLYL